MTASSPSVARASRAIERIGRLLRERESEAGLNPAQWEALRCLVMVNRFSRTPSAVAAWLATTRGTASQTLMALERKGLVARTADPRDGRACRLDLTEAGRAMLDADPMAGVAATLSKLPPLHAVALGQSLAHVLDDLLQLGGGPGFEACGTCRGFTPDAENGGACALFGEQIDADEARKPCVAHEAR